MMGPSFCRYAAAQASIRKVYGVALQHNRDVGVPCNQIKSAGRRAQNTDDQDFALRVPLPAWTCTQTKRFIEA